MTQQERVDQLLREHGRTFAAEAGITLADKPAQLYRTLVLAVLLSTRIASSIAVAAAVELRRGGMGTAKAMAEHTWQQRVDALGRGHYRRYDEQTATALGEGAQLLLDDYSGDLRKLRAEADGDPHRIHRALRKVPRLGPVGADIFCREVQSVWPELRPHFDKKALDGAEKAGLPRDPKRLARLCGQDRLAEFAAALVRVSLGAKP